MTETQGYMIISILCSIAGNTDKSKGRIFMYLSALGFMIAAFMVKN